MAKFSLNQIAKIGSTLTDTIISVDVGTRHCAVVSVGPGLHVSLWELIELVEPGPNGKTVYNPIIFAKSVSVLVDKILQEAEKQPSVILVIERQSTCKTVPYLLQNYAIEAMIFSAVLHARPGINLRSAQPSITCRYYGTAGLSYSRKKSTHIELVQQIISDDDAIFSFDGNSLSNFELAPKKDDLADAFLQAIFIALSE
jgi:hypothetical protein